MATAADVREYLTNVDFPAHRDVIVECANGEGAPIDVLKALRAMPPVKYGNKDEVMRSAHTEP